MRRYLRTLFRRQASGGRSRKKHGQFIRPLFRIPRRRCTETLQWRNRDRKQPGKRRVPLRTLRRKDSHVLCKRPVSGCGDGGHSNSGFAERRTVQPPGKSLRSLQAGDGTVPEKIRAGDEDNPGRKGEDPGIRQGRRHHAFCLRQYLTSPASP